MKKREYDFLFDEEDDEETLYTEDGINLALEEDEISSEEAGFMKGFLEEE